MAASLPLERGGLAAVSRPQRFFDAKQAAAVQKHAMLRSYSTIFVSKTGSQYKSAAVIDGNAGPGRYSDGQAGSPLLLTEMADFVEDLAGRRTVLTFVEKRRNYARQLTDLLRDRGFSEPPVITGDLDEHVDDALERARGLPLLTFLDPFGGSIAFDTVSRKLMARRGLPSEVLLHFSLISVRRKGPAALNEVTDPRLGEQLDHFLGGDWWESVMADRDPAEDGSATRQAYRVSEMYRQRVHEASRCRSVAVDVRPAPGHLPVYRMILFTRSEHGLWHFADAAGGGYLAWAKHCSDAEFEAQRLQRESSGVMSLFAEYEVAADRSEIDAVIAEQSEPIIAENLRNLLGQGPVHLGKMTERVYGETIGRAREKNVRAVCRQLMAAGEVDQNSLRTMATVTLLPRS